MFQDQPLGFQLLQCLFFSLPEKLWAMFNRMWVLQSQGLDYRKRSSNLTHKRRIYDSLEDFIKMRLKDKEVDGKKVEDEKVGLKSKEGEEVTGLGPQHAELLVRLHKLCSEEITSQMILKLCNLKEEQRMVIGQGVKTCQDEKVATLVKILNNMDKEQMDFVLVADGEIDRIVQEVEDNTVQEVDDNAVKEVEDNTLKEVEDNIVKEVEDKVVQEKRLEQIIEADNPQKVGSVQPETLNASIEEKVGKAMKETKDLLTSNRIKEEKHDEDDSEELVDEEKVVILKPEVEDHEKSATKKDNEQETMDDFATKMDAV